ncbi:Nnf1-domain-containing protein [Powellomyces hirtus]|nr:Nnf1-domain-containing protein [Powellomyces hirtus]
MASVHDNEETSDSARAEVESQYEGPRMKKLRQVFDAALTACLNGCSYDRLAQSFPRISRDNPESLRSAREQLVAFIRESIKEEFDDINADRNVALHLNEIDRIIAAAHRKLKQEYEEGQQQTTTRSRAVGSQAHVHCLHFRVTADQAVRAHAVEAKRGEVERLRAQLKQMHTANDAIQTDIAQCQAETGNVQSEIESLITNLLPPRNLLDALHQEAGVTHLPMGVA